MANASPEPFSNWFLSVGEDVFAVSLGYLALQYPTAASGGDDAHLRGDRRVSRGDRANRAALVPAVVRAAYARGSLVRGRIPETAATACVTIRAGGLP